MLARLAEEPPPGVPRRASQAARLGTEVHRWIELRSGKQLALIEPEDELDGTPLPVCRNLAVMMAATPGVPRVFVCPEGVGRVNSRLSRVEFKSGSLAEAMVIHEMLHTLGLGENPPSTLEITARVRERCR